MKRYFCIIFDVGGTFLRLNLDKLASAYMRASAARGVPLELTQTKAVIETLEREMPERSRQRLVSLEDNNGAKFWDDFYGDGFRRLGVSSDASSAVTEIRERFQHGEFEQLYDDVIPALDLLSARGFGMGILSNFSPNCENILRMLGIHHYFKFFVVSAIVGIEKPDPKIFDLAVRAANQLSPHPPLVRGERGGIVYVGDSMFHDIEGAQHAGIAAILIDRHNQYRDYRGMRIQDLRELIQFIEE